MAHPAHGIARQDSAAGRHAGPGGLVGGQCAGECARQKHAWPRQRKVLKVSARACEAPTGASGETGGPREIERGDSGNGKAPGRQRCQCQFCADNSRISRKIRCGARIMDSLPGAMSGRGRKRKPCPKGGHIAHIPRRAQTCGGSLWLNALVFFSIWISTRPLPI